MKEVPDSEISAHLNPSPLAKSYHHESYEGNEYNDENEESYNVVHETKPHVGPTGKVPHALKKQFVEMNLN